MRYGASSEADVEGGDRELKNGGEETLLDVFEWDLGRRVRDLAEP
jgi:hypothetical protein